MLQEVDKILVWGGLNIFLERREGRLQFPIFSPILSLIQIFVKIRQQNLYFVFNREQNNLDFKLKYINYLENGSIHL